MKTKIIGRTPHTVAFDARDVLVWIKCGDKSMGHSSFLITPYKLKQWIE